MITLSHFHHDGSAVGGSSHDTEATAGLQRLGIATGRWALQQHPVSSTPQLTYARELHALQRRYAAVMTDRLRWPLRHPRSEVIGPETEIPEIHVHDEIEVRVVLAGPARFVVAAGAAGGWAAIDCEPGAWIALPAGLPHALVPVAGRSVDMLRLFAHPRGWVARRTDAGPPPRLQEPAPLALAA